jgi:hypothetical protein
MPASGSTLLALTCPGAPAPARQIGCGGTPIRLERSPCAERDRQSADAEPNRVCEAVMAEQEARDRSLPPDRSRQLRDLVTY